MPEEFKPWMPKTTHKTQDFRCQHSTGAGSKGGKHIYDKSGKTSPRFYGCCLS